MPEFLTLRESNLIEKMCCRPSAYTEKQKNLLLRNDVCFDSATPVHSRGVERNKEHPHLTLHCDLKLWFISVSLAAAAAAG